MDLRRSGEVGPPAERAAECLRQAEAAERAAARCYNVVEYAEHIEAARVWRARAAAADAEHDQLK